MTDASCSRTRAPAGVSTVRLRTAACLPTARLPLLPCSRMQTVSCSAGSTASSCATVPLMETSNRSGLESTPT